MVGVLFFVLLFAILLDVLSFEDLMNSDDEPSSVAYTRWLFLNIMVPPSTLEIVPLLSLGFPSNTVDTKKPWFAGIYCPGTLVPTAALPALDVLLILASFEMAAAPPIKLYVA